METGGSMNSAKNAIHGYAVILFLVIIFSEKSAQIVDIHLNFHVI
jgi:hypothetical protein